MPIAAMTNPAARGPRMPWRRVKVRVSVIIGRAPQSRIVRKGWAARRRAALQQRSVRNAEVREAGEVVAVRADAVALDDTVGRNAQLDVDDVVAERAAVQEARRLRRVVGQDVGQ